jgi:U3-containing 90S pre-ribosomal complex subunit
MEVEGLEPEWDDALVASSEDEEEEVESGRAKGGGGKGGGEEVREKLAGTKRGREEKARGGGGGGGSGGAGAVASGSGKVEKKARRMAKMYKGRFPLPSDDDVARAYPSVQAAWLWDRLLALGVGKVEEERFEAAGMVDPESVGQSAVEAEEGSLGGVRAAALSAGGVDPLREVRRAACGVDSARIVSGGELVEFVRVKKEGARKWRSVVTSEDDGALWPLAAGAGILHRAVLPFAVQWKKKDGKGGRGFAPAVLVISANANRCTDLYRDVAMFQMGPAPLKLFARHFKLQDHVEMCRTSRSRMAVGTPARVWQLVSANALSLENLQLLVVDLWGGPKRIHVLHPVLKGTVEPAAALIHRTLTSIPSANILFTFDTA